MSAQYHMAMQGELADQNMSSLIEVALPVHNIPQELLVEVFRWLGPVVLTASVASPWLQSAAVCRRWREVICSNPRFWRQILVSNSEEWLKLSLARCRGAPAEITFFSTTFPHSELPTLLSDYVSCIRSLKFHCALPAWSTSISAILTSHSLPLLERLVILNADSSQLSVGLSMSPSQFPCLETLQLSGFRIPGEVTLLRSLRSLSVHDVSLAMPFRDFVSTLHENAVLDELSFSDSFDVSGGVLVIPTPHADPAIELPELRKFVQTSGSRSVLLHVLHNLRLPGVTDVTVWGKSVGDGFVKDGPLFISCLFPGPRPPSATFPMLEEMTGLVLDVTDDQGSLSVSNMMHRIELRLTQLPPGNYLEASIRDVVDLFSSTPISEATLCWDQEEDSIREPLWQAFLCALPRLEILSLTGFGASDELWLGLYGALAVSGPATSSFELCCPRLRSLVVGVIYVMDAENLAQMLQAVIDMLQHRVEHGLRLDELELEMEMRQDDEDATMREIYLPKLKELVDVVRYIRHPR